MRPRRSTAGRWAPRPDCQAPTESDGSCNHVRADASLSWQERVRTRGLQVTAGARSQVEEAACGSDATQPLPLAGSQRGTLRMTAPESRSRRQRPDSSGRSKTADDRTAGRGVSRRPARGVRRHRRASPAQHLLALLPVRRQPRRRVRPRAGRVRAGVQRPGEVQGRVVARHVAVSRGRQRLPEPAGDEAAGDRADRVVAARRPRRSIRSTRSMRRKRAAACGARFGKLPPKQRATLDASRLSGAVARGDREGPGQLGRRRQGEFFSRAGESQAPVAVMTHHLRLRSSSSARWRARRRPARAPRARVQACRAELGRAAVGHGRREAGADGAGAVAALLGSLQRARARRATASVRSARRALVASAWRPLAASRPRPSSWRCCSYSRTGPGAAGAACTGRARVDTRDGLTRAMMPSRRWRS